MMAAIREKLAQATMEPVLQRPLLGGGGNEPGALLCDPRARWYRSGRHAIHAALGAAGVQAGDRVLVPAYHCASMLDPARWLGALPVPYPLHSDLTVDTAALETTARTGCRAILAAHFFGVGQDLARVRDIAASAGAMLIEDCAHTVFGEHAGRYGDMAITSARKLLPQYDGGSVVPLRGNVALPAMGNRQLVYELKCAWNTFAVARARPAPIEAPSDTGSTPADSTTTDKDYRDERFDADAARRPMSMFSSLVRRLTDWSRLRAARRDNYQRLASALVGAATGHALFANLADDVVPYAFGFVLEDPRSHAQLRKLGVPMYRWEELMPSDCTVSHDYRLRLIQLPCHQGLGPAHIDAIAAQVRAVGVSA